MADQWPQFCNEKAASIAALLFSAALVLAGRNSLRKYERPAIGHALQRRRAPA